MDRYLDEARHGPTWLQKEEICNLVSESLQHAARILHFYELHAWFIMRNHIHILVQPLVEPPRFLQSVKGYTAREANRILHRSGESFWQRESYDHWIRNRYEFERVRMYIENNTVRTGIVSRPLPYGTSFVFPASGG